MKQLITHGILIPMTQDAPAFLTGSIAIENGVIVGIGEIPESFIPDSTIDASGSIVLPGLINAHTHLSMGLLRNYADDLDLHTWLTEKIWPVEAKLSEEDIYWSSLLGTAELIRFGVTSFADMYYFQEATCRAVETAGIRGNIGLTFFGDSEATTERLSAYHEMFSAWNGRCNGRIHLDAAPHAIYTCTADTLREAAAFAEEHGCRIHIHLSETRKEVEDSMREHGATPVAYVNSLGLFDIPTYAAHCVHLLEEDWSILKDNQVYPIHNPTSNLKLGSGIADVPKMLEMGLKPALGTDGSSSNNNLNLLEEMHIASILHKGFHEDPTLLTSYQVLEMATINGAKALGIDQFCGSLEIGKAADLILIDTEKPHLTPLNNPISAAVYSVQAGDIHTVMCNGEILFAQGKITAFNEREILEEARARADRIFSAKL